MRPADLPSVVYVKYRHRIARVAAQWCSGDGHSGALVVAHSLWCCLWLHMLAGGPLKVNSWMMERNPSFGCLLLLLLLLLLEPPLVHRRFTRQMNKYQVLLRKYSQFSLETDATFQICAAGWSDAALPVVVVFHSACFACLLFFVGSFSTMLRPSAQRLGRPFVSVVCFRISDYFMLLVLSWAISLW